MLISNQKLQKILAIPQQQLNTIDFNEENTCTNQADLENNGGAKKNTIILNKGALALNLSNANNKAILQNIMKE